MSIVAAEAALENLPYYDEYISEVISSREWIIEELSNNNISVKNTDANFIMLQAAYPGELIKNLADRGVYIRDRSFMPQLEGYVRIAIGTFEQTKRLKQALLELPG